MSAARKTPPKRAKKPARRNLAGELAAARQEVVLLRASLRWSDGVANTIIAQLSMAQRDAEKSKAEAAALRVQAEAERRERRAEAEALRKDVSFQAGERGYYEREGERLRRALGGLALLAGDGALYRAERESRDHGAAVAAIHDGARP